MKTNLKHKSFHIITLGCSKNLVDSEKLMAQLKANNFSVVHNAYNSDARTVIINTCGFINDAKQESIDTILQYVNAKASGLIDNIFVIGCLSQRYKNQIIQEIPEVDAVFGTNCTEDIIKKLNAKYKKDLVGERVITTPSHYAYLKISEGCNRTCSFCAIPFIRGKHISRPVDDIVNEAKWLAERGVKELILIAQDLTYYGIDLYNKKMLSVLLEKLTDIEKIKWIRLHYAYPASFPKDILKLIKERDKICKYLDIPFQHISDKILRQMRRGINSQSTYKLIDQIRKVIPDLTLRTTLIVGYPGETEDNFNELIDFIQSVKFERLGAFAYSEEEGTYAAIHHKNNIPDQIKTSRLAILMEMQEKISYKMNKEKIGKCYKAIIDRKEGKYYIGRTEADSPEVDNEVIIKSVKPLKTGEFYNIKIINAEAFDLHAVIE
jgi:ribosomal protein S12 methylthiotransferase